MHNSICPTWVTSGAVDSQPDITIAVGNAQPVKFIAHRFVLSSCSGYFKTLLASLDGLETHISNIGSHTFAYLLSFMYTGHLELNPVNVYEIFAASNWLQMAEAVELCQQYLVHKHHYTLSLLQSSVVKPIPRRNVAAPLQQSCRLLQYQPLRLHNESGSIFKPVSRQLAEDVDIDAEDGKCQSPISKKTDSPSDNAVLDVACCDGPIKFHRITNQFYDPEKAIASAKEESTGKSCHKCSHLLSSQLQLRLGLGCQLSRAPPDQSVSEVSIMEAKNKKKAENMQCYSCKTCGSKFPSYYFVHKHRKLHHQDNKEFIE